MSHKKSEKIYLVEVKASDGWIWSGWFLGGPGEDPGEEDRVRKTARTIFDYGASDGLHALEVNAKMTDFTFSPLFCNFIPMREADEK